MDTSMILFPADAIGIVGNAFQYAVNANVELGGYWIQNPAQTADQFRWERWFAPGVWTWEMNTVRQTAAGKGTFYITPDFSSFLVSQNIDFRGTAAVNVKYSNSFTVPEPGGKLIVGMDGTGASSGTTYTRPISRIELYKTADV